MSDVKQQNKRQLGHVTAPWSELMLYEFKDLQAQDNVYALSFSSKMEPLGDIDETYLEEINKVHGDGKATDNVKILGDKDAYAKLLKRVVGVDLDLDLGDDVKPVSVPSLQEAFTSAVKAFRETFPADSLENTKRQIITTFHNNITADVQHILGWASKKFTTEGGRLTGEQANSMLKLCDAFAAARENLLPTEKDPKGQWITKKLDDDAVAQIFENHLT